jgi:hypothetical protein
LGVRPGLVVVHEGASIEIAEIPLNSNAVTESFQYIRGYHKRKG